MDSLGLVIFKNGDKVPFGKPVYMDQKGYTDLPGHEECFKKEVVPSFNFKLEDYEYNKDDNFYRKVIELSNEGLIIILNNKCNSYDPDRTLGYMASELTSEQVNTLKEMIENKEFEGYIQELYEFVDEEPTMYNSLEEYYNMKKVKER